MPYTSEAKKKGEEDFNLINVTASDEGALRKNISIMFAQQW
jgi:hypothetical protein